VDFLQRSRKISDAPHCRAILRFPCRPAATGTGASHMTIDTLVLILISTLAVAFVLNRLDMRRL
jgi:hypothetical protein